MPHPADFPGRVAPARRGGHIPGMRRGGGFGFVILLVVLAVIFYAAMRNLQSVSPAALEIQKHNAERKRQTTAPSPVAPDESASASSTSASADTWTPSPPARPNLNQMDQATSQHTNQVKDALSQSN